MLLFDCDIEDCKYILYTQDVYSILVLKMSW